ncbi:hypothetical protein E2C01_001358 [Portunus trituberculatus]|uniref:Uncharacterized protein n=1 Tax=Portunus trituberculatus TaxID=210409 RepID=A0A5B7CGZ8_PORTR|nr:hypothetical protein [Portunus trituberculatus]
MKSQCLRNIKKFGFPHRMVDIWNGLSDEILTAESVHKFKAPQGSRLRVESVMTTLAWTKNCKSDYLVINAEGHRMYPADSSIIYCGRMNAVTPLTTSSNLLLVLPVQLWRCYLPLPRTSLGLRSSLDVINFEELVFFNEKMDLQKMSQEDMEEEDDILTILNTIQTVGWARPKFRLKKLSSSDHLPLFSSSPHSSTEEHIKDVHGRGEASTSTTSFFEGLFSSLIINFAFFFIAKDFKNSGTLPVSVFPPFYDLELFQQGGFKTRAASLGHSSKNY